MGTKIGLRFRKLDLHVHTPASVDYKDKKATPQNIIEQALKANLAAVAITDHQTGEWIDGVKSAANGKDITVFPGVELLVTGGEHGVHVICLFDRDKNTKWVTQFLNTLQIYDKCGERTVCTELSAGKVADALYVYDPSAVMVLAHSHSTKGVLGDIKGATRTKIFEGSDLPPLN